jgi:hypothetical protein
MGEYDVLVMALAAVLITAIPGFNRRLARMPLMRPDKCASYYMSWTSHSWRWSSESRPAFLPNRIAAPLMRLHGGVL